MCRPCLHVGDVRNAHLADGLSAARLVPPGAKVRGSRITEKETVKVYILLARGIYTGSQCAAKKVRGASGRALGRGGFFEPSTLSTEDPDLASDPLLLSTV